MAEQYVYKIRKKSDGLFSTGGSRPRFTKKGKVWASIGHIRNHLNLPLGYSDIPAWTQYVNVRDLEVVQYAVGEVSVWPLKQFTKEKDERKTSKATAAGSGGTFSFPLAIQNKA